MAKLVLTDTKSGYNLAAINDNFDKLVDATNNKSLSRDNPTGDANQMLVPLDMNGQRIINLPTPVSLNEPARLQDLVNAAIGVLPILPASLINVTPGHGIAATNVQAAIYELADDTIASNASIAAETSARTTAVSSEAATRASADATLTTSVNALNTLTATHTTQIAALNSPVVATTFNVDSVAVLRTVGIVNHKYIQTSGYYAPGDGGEGLYWYNSADTTSADNGGTIIVGLSGTRWYLQNRTTNFKQWGAKGDGVTDDCSIMQTAINTVAPGSRIILPRGSYRISNTLTVYGGRSIEGTSRDSDVSGGSCQIICDLSVLIAVATNQIDSTAAVTLRNFTIKRAAGAIPAGSIGLRVFGSDQQVVEDVNIYRHEVGLEINQCLSAYIHRVNTWYCTWAHIQLTSCVEPHIYQCRFGRNGAADAACVQYVAVNNGVDTVRFDTCQFNQSGATVTQCVKWYSYNNSNGIFHFHNCHMEAWTAAVFVADAPTMVIQRLKVTHSSITINGSGAQFYIGAAGVLRDCTFTNSNFDVACNFDSHIGIAFVGNNVSGVFTFNSGRYSVSGNCFGSNVTLTGVPNHGVLVGNSILGTLTNSATGAVVASNA